MLSFVCQIILALLANNVLRSKQCRVKELYSGSCVIDLYLLLTDNADIEDDDRYAAS